MKKIVFILLILTLSILSSLLFHEKGNAYLKPYIATYIEHQLANNSSVEVKELKIDLDHVEFVAVLNELTEVTAEGALSLFARSLEIDYTLKSDGFKTFENKIDINGTVMGSFNDLHIQGEGETLKSHINYALEVKNELIHNIQVSIHKADIASLLALTSQEPYAKGSIDIDIDIPTLKEVNTKGKAKIRLYPTTLNEKIFQQVFNINLPPKTIVTANLNAKISADAFALAGDIKSNLATLKLSDATYDLNTKEFLTQYLLNVPKLSKLTSMTKKKLQGELTVEGEIFAKKDAFNLNGKSRSFGGETLLNFNGQKLNLELKKVKISKVLHLLGEQPYAKGKLMATLKLSDVKNLKGSFQLHTQEAKTVHHTLKKLLDFGKPIAFSLKSKGEITSDTVTAQSTLNSDIFNYHSEDIHYELKDAILASNYVLNIPKLSKLSTLAGKNLQGSLNIKGKMNYNKSLEVTGSTQSLGGDIDFNLFNQKLKAKIKSVPVQKLMLLLDYPQLFKALLLGEFNYDLTTQKGTFVSKLNKAQLLTSQLTELVKQLRGVDLTRERYNETEFNALLNKNFIDFDFKAKSKKVLLEIPNGQIIKASNHIDARYTINIDNKDLGGKIKGNIANPKITFNSSSYLQDKVMEIMKGNISKETLNGLGIENIEPEMIHDTMKSIFGNLFK